MLKIVLAVDSQRDRPGLAMLPILSKNKSSVGPGSAGRSRMKTDQYDSDPLGNCQQIGPLSYNRHRVPFRPHQVVIHRVSSGRSSLSGVAHYRRRTRSVSIDRNAFGELSQKAPSGRHRGRRHSVVSALTFLLGRSSCTVGGGLGSGFFCFHIQFTARVAKRQSFRPDHRM